MKNKWEEENPHKTIKVLKLEVEEVPVGYIKPYIEYVVPKMDRLRFDELHLLQSVPTSEETFTKERYNLESFMTGSGTDEIQLYVKEGYKHAVSTILGQAIQQTIANERKRIADEVEKMDIGNDKQGFPWGTAMEHGYDKAIDDILTIINKEE